ncbi:glycoside hydrolase family 3 protein [Pseudoxanthomonas kalamensis]|uniref:glycoside hydrolase family 3 protein n=1 Tax=Pseudoxanthomonas kalamensis TaxID=289483 RepID=UPI001FE7F741|nr:glycoside hydrolase family 3 protein [Pseudoxanthomonas kalamensis]
MSTAKTLALSSLCLAVLLGACRNGSDTSAEQSATPAPAGAAALSDWPQVRSAIGKDPALEQRIDGILSGMTLAQKVGQMTQAEIKSITPDEVRQYYIGSVLNGGGSWPGKNKHASVQDWLNLADAYYAASMATDMKVPVPIIWGTDAVHGHSNVFGATIFPHNIGLGAAHDAELIERIGEATARSTRATGIDWAFSPTLAVAQDARWGRTYESFSSTPELVREYGAAYVRGMQGTFADEGNLVATAKHFIGDGATENGKDQGVARVTLDELINVHGQGYYGALEAGAQTIMASYNSWTDAATGTEHGKMHGNRDLLTGAIKEKMGFDGFIVSDWNAIGQLPGCSNSSCALSINAGIDMVMVPDDWKAFIANTVAQVESGEIAMERIDDAVRRILRVKLRAGLFDGKSPSQNRYAGKPESLLHRDLARRAVRESLVLLKNDGAALPIRHGQRVLVVGKSADNIPNQTGGWSLTWQGTENSNADYPNADSILTGLRTALGDANVVFAQDGDTPDPAGYDLVVAVIGETPYAETSGDLVPSSTVGHSQRHPEDLKTLQAARTSGKPVITVFLSGRPLYVNDLLNLSDAFVAAWLPGTEGSGVADVLVAGDDGKPVHDFAGRLTFPWPAAACPAADGQPQFAVGYGLGYADSSALGTLAEDATISCGEATMLPIFNMADIAPFALTLSAGDKQRALGSDLNQTLRWPENSSALQIATVQINTQQDAKEVTWLAPATFMSRNPSRNNLVALAEANAALQFDMVLRHVPTSKTTLAMACGNDCVADIDLTATLSQLPQNERHTIKVPLRCFAERGADLAGIETPFAISADAPFAAAFTNIRIVAGAGKDADALACPVEP